MAKKGNKAKPEIDGKNDVINVNRNNDDSSALTDNANKGKNPKKTY